MENQINAFEWYKQYAIDIKKDKNFLVCWDNKGFMVFTNELHDIRAILIVFENAQLGMGLFGECSSRRNSISKSQRKKRHRHWGREVVLFGI